jgi:hypothetical protein
LAALPKADRGCSARSLIFWRTGERFPPPAPTVISAMGFEAHLESLYEFYGEIAGVLHRPQTSGLVQPILAGSRRIPGASEPGRNPQ